MSQPSQGGWVVGYTRWLIKWKYLVIPLCLIVALAAGSGARFLAFDTDYRAFFSEENPQLLAFEALQNIYTKNDNVMFMVETKDGKIFTKEHLAAIEELTEEAWQVPFTIRVDAITNFQNTTASEDDLLVEDLVEDAMNLSAAQIENAKQVALAEPVIVNRLLSNRAHVAGVNATLQLPGDDINEVPEAVAYARDLEKRIEAKYPDINVRLSGVVMLNNAFSEAGMKDMSTLNPIMYAGMFLVMLILLRSLMGSIATMIVVAFSTVTAMGLAGYYGIKLTPPSVTAPTMIMTLAIADSIHVLVTMLTEMRGGRTKYDAIVESMRINMTPVFLTSVTTAIGFLSLNFSDAPPFRDLGNITATGVMAAFVFSVVLLPALVAALPVRAKALAGRGASPIERFAEFVISKRKPLLWASVVTVVALAAFIPSNELNDQFVEYFDERIEFRRDSDFMAENLTGIYQVEYSITADGENGISDPGYLAKLEEFSNWFRQQDGVLHVATFTDVMKRLNKTLHGDDPSWYRVPDNRELAAQYLLLYELSLPFGLDLNNQINIDKSATRFSATLANVSSNEIRAIGDAGQAWLRTNAPAHMDAVPAGPAYMFSHISKRNIISMVSGTTAALILISLLLIFALRSFKYGAISLIPNLVPAVLAFGLWGLLVGKVGVGLSVVTGMTLGIVVDDSIHFLSKYIRARREKGLSAPDAVRYAFRTVGVALTVTTIILVAGFLVLSQSSFEMNSGMGRLTAIAIFLALVADFVLLPPVLIAIDGRKSKTSTQEVSNEAAVGTA